MGPEERAAAIAAMTEEQLEELHFEWEFWRRDEQTPPPGDWRVWLYLAGRGSGKTRTGAEFVRASVIAGCRRIALVAPTAADARDVIVEGESGILAVSPPDKRPVYERRPSSMWAWSSGRCQGTRRRTNVSTEAGATAMAFSSASFPSAVLPIWSRPPRATPVSTFRASLATRRRRSAK
jgi:phage terminase large subunit-like protein